MIVLNGYQEHPIVEADVYYIKTVIRQVMNNYCVALHLAKTTERMGFFIVVFESRAILETVWYKNDTVIARIALTLYLAPYSTTQ